MIEVPLTKGKVALIDDEDAERVLAHRWIYQYKKGHGYAVRRGKIREGGRVVRMHRFILNAPPNMQVDHINGNGLDNRKANLRLATFTQNARNKGARRNNTSGYKGVIRQHGKWAAQILIDRKHFHLGAYESPEDAAHAYDVAAAILHGEFAQFNFPEESELIRFVLGRINIAQAAE